MNKNPLELVLNDIEKDSLSRLADDLTMLNSVKKVLLFGIYFNGTLRPGQAPEPMMNFAMQLDKENIRTNEQLGAVLRAAQEGIIAIEVAFKEIEKFKVVKDVEKKVINGAR